MANAAKNDAKITPERLEEALDVRDRLIIELLVKVLDEKLVIERPVLRERLGNLVDLSKYDAELKETLHAVINKL
ncbi:phosphate-starvation-inducible protein PsiE [Lysinibacillus sp. NPDC097279]|uniref:phosphate-starvation-inducible protein PsiE n=1 Tax=Bacillati TaxID=1783272 RepID=UPI0011712F47|nr:phosphate-starvation-inducible protein PsiE [Lysinibacillus sp. CD3-6]QPQ33796.1 phosphate-starvation-inducible protein PsiE [Lysinibacillus sp. JNUCC-52]UED80264.1 phosphate-starvation-inducible protein PsiE [Lysinibacillus sp. CD3-6]